MELLLGILGLLAFMGAPLLYSIFFEKPHKIYKPPLPMDSRLATAWFDKEYEEKKKKKKKMKRKRKK